MSTVTHSGTENPEFSSESLAKPDSWTCVLDFVDTAFFWDTTCNFPNKLSHTAMHICSIWSYALRGCWLCNNSCKTSAFTLDKHRKWCRTFTDISDMRLQGKFAYNSSHCVKAVNIYRNHLLSKWVSCIQLPDVIPEHLFVCCDAVMETNSLLWNWSSHESKLSCRSRYVLMV